MRAGSVRCRSITVADFGHGDDVTTPVIGDFRHETADQEQAATARAFDGVIESGVGDIFGIEPRPFIGDFDIESFVGNFQIDLDLLVWIHLIAVLDGINKSFFDGQFDGESGMFVIPQFSKRGLDPVLEEASFRQVAGDRDIFTKRLDAHRDPAAGSLEVGGPPAGRTRGRVRRHRVGLRKTGARIVRPE